MKEEKGDLFQSRVPLTSTIRLSQDEELEDPRVGQAKRVKLEQ